jgi:hypothetical protein
MFNSLFSAYFYCCISDPGNIFQVFQSPNWLLHLYFRVNKHYTLEDSPNFVLVKCVGEGLSCGTIDRRGIYRINFSIGVEEGETNQIITGLHIKGQSENIGTLHKGTIR